MPREERLSNSQVVDRYYEPRVELRHVLHDIRDLERLSSRRWLTVGERAWGMILQRRAAELLREVEEGNVAKPNAN